MGPKNKKNKKEGNKQIPIVGDGDMSEASVDTIELAADEVEVGAAEETEETLDRAEIDRQKISAAVDDLSEKRGKTRENALRELTTVLQMAHISHEDSLSGFSETLSSVILQCLNRGGIEGVYTANLLSVMFVVLGQSGYGSEIWRRTSTKLRVIANKRDLGESRDCAASASAFLSYSMGLVCCGGENDLDEVESALELCVELASGHMNTTDGTVTGHVSAEVRTVAFQNWGFLAASVSLSSRAARCSAMLPHVASILNIESGDYDVDLRNEAGQLAALLAEITAEAKTEAQANGEEFFGGGGDADHWESVRTSLHRLANDSSKRLSKTAKKEQHATFRRFLSSLDDTSEGVRELDAKSTPNAIVSFNGGKVTCETWLEYGKLAQLRRCLNSGLPDHLSLGQVAALVMSESLEVEDVINDNEQEHGKRSAAGKEKMSKRGKERSNKEQEKNSFFDQDE